MCQGRVKVVHVVNSVVPFEMSSMKLVIAILWLIVAGVQFSAAITGAEGEKL